MELLHATNIDFMKYRKFWITISFALVALGILSIFLPTRLNFGIDFAGGTQMTLRFGQEPPVDRIRSLLEQAGLGQSQIQRFGDQGSNEVIIKTAVAKGSEEGDRERIIGALNRRFNQTLGAKPDLNRINADQIAELLVQADPDGLRPQGEPVMRAHYTAVGEAILKVRRTAAIFTSWDQVKGVAEVSPAALQALQQATGLGDYAILGFENVGPQIGRELQRQGLMAVAASLVGMLLYIWFRFELRFGIGAVMASLHDVLVTFGLFALMGYEFNLTTVAAFLTLIGYSVNDTVIIFDRIRENMRKNRRKPLIETMNESINQTLSRTIMTSTLTLLTVAALLVFGGDVLRGFAFVMTVGIVVGTYSSIYVASPFALLWEQLAGTKTKGGTGGGARRPGEPRTAADDPGPAAPDAKPVAPPTRKAPASRRASRR